MINLPDLGIMLTFLVALLSVFFVYMWFLQSRYYGACKEQNNLLLFSQSPAGLPSGTIRAVQDMERGSKADQLTQRLLDTSQRFLEAEPGDPSAVYYNASARYTQLRPALLQSPTQPDLCPHLNELIGALNTAMPRASGTDYQQNITRLQSDISGAKHTVAGCN